MKGRVLLVAGSDSGGGAGIQADIKTVTALNGYAATAITALTAQNTEGVEAIYEVPAEFVVQQMKAVLDDIGADIIKTGMLHREELIERVVETLGSYTLDNGLLVDPVMYAKGGAALLEECAIRTLVTKLIPMAALVTPNLPEAEKILNGTVKTVEDMRAAALDLLSLGPKAVLLKGGHLTGAKIIDLLATPNGVEVFESTRIDTPHTHGTGCTLASAIAISIAQGMPVRSAVIRARKYVYDAIGSAPGYGGGHGPINHGHPVPENLAYEA